MSRPLTPKQFRAVQLLARGVSAAEIARALRLRRETLSRWKKDPAFAAEFDRILQELRDTLQQRLTALVDTSISSLRTELNSFQGDPRRIQTALNVLQILAAEQLRPKNTPEKPE